MTGVSMLACGTRAVRAWLCAYLPMHPRGGGGGRTRPIEQVLGQDLETGVRICRCTQEEEEDEDTACMYFGVIVWSELLRHVSSEQNACDDVRHARLRF